jgi:hypothetical protein
MAHVGDIKIHVDPGQFEDVMHDTFAAYCLMDAHIALDQFIADGGQPWDIYKIEQSLLGETLEQMARSSNWQMS